MYEGKLQCQPYFGSHSTMLPFLWWAGLSPKYFWLQSFSPFPLDCLLTANNGSLPVPMLQRTHSSPQPSCTLVNIHTQAGAHKDVALTICVVLTLSCLLETSYCTLHEPLKLFFCCSCSPICGNFPHLQHLTRNTGPAFLLFISFLSFVLPGCMVIFPVSLGVLRIIL